MSSDSPPGGLGVHPRVYDRIVRIVSLSLIAAIALAVTVGDLWLTTRPAIYVVLGVMTIFLLLVQDVIPPEILGRRRFAIEAVAGIGFITVLAMLTGGSSSPFFFGYFLIVAGAALWITGTAPILLAVLTALVYLIGIALAPSVVGTTAAGTLSMVGFNLLGLGLMAYLATVAGREQRRINDRAVRLSRYDSLTELYYRAYFLELLEREIQRAVRTGRPFCLLMLDLDGLKPINDTFGHPLGDAMLRAVADVIRREIRASDSAARYGGDEFIVLLPETDPQGAVVLAEKLRADIAHINIRLPDRSITTSVSIGLASYPADGDTSERLIRVVDQAMYEAKRLGKNRIAYPAHIDAIPRAVAAAPPTEAAAPPAEAAAPPAEAAADADPGVPVMAPRAAPRPPAKPGTAAGQQRGGAPAGPETARPDDPVVNEAARSRPGPQPGPRPPADRLSAARPADSAPIGTSSRGVERPVPSVYTTADDPFDPWLQRATERPGEGAAPVASVVAVTNGVAVPSETRVANAVGTAAPPRPVGQAAPGAAATGAPPSPDQRPPDQRPPAQRPSGQGPTGVPAGPPSGQRPTRVPTADPPTGRPPTDGPSTGEPSAGQASAPEPSSGRPPIERPTTTDPSTDQAPTAAQRHGQPQAGPQMQRDSLTGRFSTGQPSTGQPESRWGPAAPPPGGRQADGQSPTGQAASGAGAPSSPSGVAVPAGSPSPAPSQPSRTSSEPSPARSRPSSAQSTTRPSARRPSAPAAAAPPVAPAPPRAAVPLFGPAGSPGAPMPVVHHALRTPSAPRPVMDRSTSPEEASWADLPETGDTDTALR